MSIHKKYVCVCVCVCVHACVHVAGKATCAHSWDNVWGRLKRSATIWASGRTREPCFEILGASLLPCGVGFDASST